MGEDLKFNGGPILKYVVFFSVQSTQVTDLSAED